MTKKDRPQYLIISYLYPLPENTGGRMRTMNFVRFFQGHGDVDLLYLSPESKGPEVAGPFRREYCIKMRSCDGRDSEKERVSSVQDFVGKIKRIVERRPSVLTEWSTGAEKELESLLTSHQYNVILCRYIFNTYPFFRLPTQVRKRIVIDFDDFYSDVNLLPGSDKTGNLFKKLKWIVEHYLFVNYQKRCLSFGAVLICSKKDRDIICRDAKRGNVFVIPNTYPNGQFSGQVNNRGYENRNTMLFVGTLNYGPNANGLDWFLKTIFPQIRIITENSRFLIVGRDPGQRLKTVCNEIPGVELYPNVPDVGIFYDQCGVVVVPILSGGGTRIKILEAAIAGKPVFSTPFGAYGLDVTDGKDIMIFSDSKEFKERYQRLNEKTTYDTIRDNLRKTVETNYSPEAFANAMEVVIDNL